MNHQRCPFKFTPLNLTTEEKPAYSSGLETLTPPLASKPSRGSREEYVDMSEAIKYLHSLVPIFREKTNSSANPMAVTAHGFNTHLKTLPETLNDQFREVTPDQIAQFRAVLENSGSRREFIRSATILTVKMFMPHLEEPMRVIYRECRKAARAMPVRNEVAEWLDVFDEHLSNFRPNISRQGSTKQKQQVYMLYDIINGGIQNVAHVSWSFFDVAAQLVSKPTSREENSADIRSKQFKDSISSVQSMILAIVSSHDDIFHSFEKVLRRPHVCEDVYREFPYRAEEFAQFFWELYHPSDFGLVNGHLKMRTSTLNTAATVVLRRFSKGMIECNEPRIGCAGTLIIPTVCRFSRTIAESLLKDSLSTFVDLPDDTGSYDRAPIVKDPYSPKSSTHTRELKLPQSVKR